MPGEVEILAARLGLSFEELFRTRLAVDVVGTVVHGDIFVLMPALVGVEVGAKLPPATFGACTFFDEGGCGIHHQGKPYECAMATHVGGADPSLMAAAWLPYRDVIRGMLGELHASFSGRLADLPVGLGAA